MRHREQFYITVSLFLIFSIVLFLFGKSAFFTTGIGFLETVVRPFQNATFAVGDVSKQFFSNSKYEELEKENQGLRKQLVDQEELKKENSALKDQFVTTISKKQKLIPAKIIGRPSFIPNVSLPSFFVLSAGAKDGVFVNQTVVVQDNLVGKISKVSQSLSVVTLITNPLSSFTAETKDDILGVIKGQGEETLLFNNVLGSKTLRVEDTVTTKGDINENGTGYPPNLVVGKIISIDKTQSNLFQTALVKSAVSFETLDMVFLVGKLE